MYRRRWDRAGPTPDPKGMCSRAIPRAGEAIVSFLRESGARAHQLCRPSEAHGPVDVGSASSSPGVGAFDVELIYPPRRPARYLAPCPPWATSCFARPPFLRPRCRGAAAVSDGNSCLQRIVARRPRDGPEIVVEIAHEHAPRPVFGHLERDAAGWLRLSEFGAFCERDQTRPRSAVLIVDGARRPMRRPRAPGPTLRLEPGAGYGGWMSDAKEAHRAPREVELLRGDV